jgi:hypothetical protein
VATGKDIHGGVTVFRPGVNGDMRLSNDHYTTNAVRAEGVKDFLHNNSTGADSALKQNGADAFSVVQNFCGATVSALQKLNPKLV